MAAGFAIGILQSWTVAYEAPELLTQVLVFLIMAAVLLWRPSGLFGREETMA